MNRKTGESIQELATMIRQEATTCDFSAVKDPLICQVHLTIHKLMELVQSLRTSSLPPRQALQEFLMQARRTPSDTGYSPSEILNGRQIRSRLVLPRYYQHQWTWRPDQKQEKLDRVLTSNLQRECPVTQNSLDTWMTGNLNGFLQLWQKFRDLGQWKSSWHQMGFYKNDMSINYKEDLQAGEEEIQEDSKEDSKKQSPGSPKVLSATRSPRPQSTTTRLID